MYHFYHHHEKAPLLLLLSSFSLFPLSSISFTFPLAIQTATQPLNINDVKQTLERESITKSQATNKNCMRNYYIRKRQVFATETPSRQNWSLTRKMIKESKIREVNSLSQKIMAFASKNRETNIVAFATRFQQSFQLKGFHSLVSKSHSLCNKKEAREKCKEKNRENRKIKG